MKESDLYLPLKQYLEQQGYEVKGEVRNCDVVAKRGDEEPVVVELKLNFNLSVLLQVVERLSVTSKVYVGVPIHCTVLKKKRKPVIKLLRLLGLGLVAIDPEVETVDVLLDPGEYKPRISKQKQGRLLGEFEKRVGDPNLGGVAMRKGIMTSYRQRALVIGQYLQQNGATKASLIAEATGDKKARDILYRNVYGWFEGVSRGVYELTPRGVEEIALWRG